jgi:hypothetical protein
VTLYDPAVGGALLREMLGCEWGYRIALPDDQAEYQERAVQYVQLHGGERDWLVKLCATHRALVFNLTDPHAAPAPGAAQNAATPGADDTTDGGRGC